MRKIDFRKLCEVMIWGHKTRIFADRQMDISVDEAVNNGILKEGDDILDLYLATEKINKLNLAI